MISLFVIFAFLTSLGLLLFVLVYVYILYSKEVKIRAAQERQLAEIEKTITSANNRAEGIIEHAVDKAQLTILKSDYLRDDLIKSLEASLAEVAHIVEENLTKDEQKFEQDNEKLYQQIRAEFTQRVDVAIKNLEEATRAELDDFRKVLSEETVGAQNIITKKINEEFSEVRTEIETYKQTQIKKIDATISQILKKASYELIGKTIDLADHEALIKASVEEALAEGFLGNGIKKGIGESVKG